MYPCTYCIFRLFLGFDLLLVFRGCVAHCPTLSNLKQYSFVVSQNTGSGIWAQISTVLYKTAIKVLARTGFSSESLTGEGLSSKLGFFLALEDLVDCFLEARNGE